MRLAVPFRVRLAVCISQNQAREMQSACVWIPVCPIGPGPTDARGTLEPGSRNAEFFFVSPEPWYPRLAREMGAVAAGGGHSAVEGAGEVPQEWRADGCARQAMGLGVEAAGGGAWGPAAGRDRVAPRDALQRRWGGRARMKGSRPAAGRGRAARCGGGGSTGHECEGRGR